jgi:hypothetical protein
MKFKNHNDIQDIIVFIKMIYRVHTDSMRSHWRQNCEPWQEDNTAPSLHVYICISSIHRTWGKYIFFSRSPLQNIIIISDISEICNQSLYGMSEDLQHLQSVQQIGWCQHPNCLKRVPKGECICYNRLHGQAIYWTTSVSLHHQMNCTNGRHL